MKVAQLVDSKPYAYGNCWQHQIIESLQERCDLHVIELNSLEKHDWRQFDAVLSTLKLRTLVRELDRIKNSLAKVSLLIYEQDPWEAFIDTGGYRGAYQRIFANLQVTSFLTTSQHWSKHIRQLGMPSSFIKMWMLSKYCDYQPWSSRPIKLGFMGTLHPYRARFFERLKLAGIDVDVRPSSSYADWLTMLSQTQFFIHNEDENVWSIDGSPIIKNCCWAKEIEVASRGCFAIRQWEPECEAYHVSQIPSIVTYINEVEIPSLIQRISSDPATDDHSNEGVKFIKSQDAWSDLFQALNKDLSVR